jgi:transcriptional regulator with XRE-family HTH domain
MTGDELRDARKQLGLTQPEFAKAFQVDVRTVGGFEQGERNGRPSKVPPPLALLVGFALRHRTIRRELGIKS